MEKKIFKKKLTLTISGSTKKTSDKIEYAKVQNKNSIIIEKKHTKSGFRKTGQHFNKKQTRPEIWRFCNFKLKSRSYFDC